MFDILLRFHDRRIEDAFWASPAVKNALLSVDQLSTLLAWINNAAGVLWCDTYFPVIHHHVTAFQLATCTIYIHHSSSRAALGFLLGRAASALQDYVTLETMFHSLLLCPSTQNAALF